MNDRGADCYRRFLEGDKVAFEEIVKDYGDSLVRFAYCFLHDSAAAEDAVAETFAVLLVKRRKFSEDARFRPYLYRVARNKCIDYLRKMKRCEQLNDAENVFCGDAERDISDRERDRQIFLCLQRLPEQYRNALYLTYFDGFSVREVCEIMRKNEKQVYNLLARAKSNLKEIFIEEGLNENL